MNAQRKIIDYAPNPVIYTYEDYSKWLDRKAQLIDEIEANIQPKGYFSKMLHNIAKKPFILSH